MGSRDYRHREQKKPRKVAKKVSETSVLPPSTIVEVVKKGKKDKEEFEEEGKE